MIANYMHASLLEVSFLISPRGIANPVSSVFPRELHLVMLCMAINSLSFTSPAGGLGGRAVLPRISMQQGPENSPSKETAAAYLQGRAKVMRQEALPYLQSRKEAYLYDTRDSAPSVEPKDYSRMAVQAAQGSATILRGERSTDEELDTRDSAPSAVPKHYSSTAPQAAQDSASTLHGERSAGRSELTPPASWQPVVDDLSGETYYYNPQTGASMWPPGRQEQQPDVRAPPEGTAMRPTSLKIEDDDKLNARRGVLPAIIVIVAAASGAVVSSMARTSSPHSALSLRTP